MTHEKRYHILRHGGEDSFRTVRTFDTWREAEAWMLDVCDDFEAGDKIGWWFLESEEHPVMLEIVDWSEQMEPEAVC